MSTGRSTTAVVLGVAAHQVRVEAHVAAGLPQWHMVGLPDTAVSESRDRVRAAAASSGLAWPAGRITVGLSPASLPKRGSGLDLGIAVAVLSAANPPPQPGRLADWMFVGELGLDGTVRPVGTVLPAAIAARASGLARFVVPWGNRREASLVSGLDVLPVVSLRHLWAVLSGDEQSIAAEEALGRDDGGLSADQMSGGAVEPDLADVRGQDEARQALVVAAAGGHHLCLSGPAGVGKTLIASRLPSLLPDLTDEESLEATAIRALTSPEAPTGLVRRPPVCRPHHSASDVALVGGGSVDRPRIGLATRAHGGVLFLDEAAEFSAGALDALRQAMEARTVSLARAGFQVELPARFQLVLATNPCPCGRALDTAGRPCGCSSAQRRRYLARLNGPLLDRVDVRLTLRRPTAAELAGLTGSSESSARARDRVVAARGRAKRRLDGSPWSTNAAVPAHEVRRNWPVPPDLQEALDLAANSRESIRGLDLCLRLAWTIADLRGADHPGAGDLRAAIDLRDPQEWVV